MNSSMSIEIKKRTAVLSHGDGVKFSQGQVLFVPRTGLVCLEFFRSMSHSDCHRLVPFRPIFALKFGGQVAQ